MTNHQPYRLKTVSEFHRLRGLPTPEHPLISVINVEDMKIIREEDPHINQYPQHDLCNLPHHQ